MPLDDVSRKIYDEELKGWLPPRVIDCHIHIGLPEHVGHIDPERFREMWALEVAQSFSWEQMHATLDLLFPDTQVSALVFGWVVREIDIERNNEYVLQGVRDTANRATALAVAKPEWDPEQIVRLLDSGFIGIKPYPDLAPQCSNEVSIYDFLPHSHLKVLDDRAAVLVLHLPRKGRLADPDNIRELLDLADRYPSIKLVVAHIGRAYCLPNAQAGLPHFVDRPNIRFDTAAHLNPDVFAYALELLGPDRLLYGSDLPTMLMRGVREHVGDKYINYTDGDYSWNTDRKTPEQEASYTYFIYEELRAIIQALRRVGMGRDEMEKIMYRNTASVIGVAPADE